MAGDETVPSVFDEDPELQRDKRLRQLRRIRSTLITSGLLIVLPVLVRRLMQASSGIFDFSIPGRNFSFLTYAAAVLLVYFLLGHLALKRPYTALLAGLGIYLALQVWIIYESPASLYNGWMFRVIVILNLGMPLQKARALQ